MHPSRCSKSSKSWKIGLNVDLNLPFIENPDQMQDSVCSHPQTVGEGLGVDVAPIDLETFDDDVIISSPRAFAEAKNKSRRNLEQAVVIDLDSASQNNRQKRRRPAVNQAFINSDICINLEITSNSKSPSVHAVAPPPPPPPPKEISFNCPVCMGPLVEEMSTKCGHIFCKECIKTAIATQKKCPTCRRKVTPKDIIRVYLPATTCS